MGGTDDQTNAQSLALRRRLPSASAREMPRRLPASELILFFLLSLWALLAGGCVHFSREPIRCTPYTSDDVKKLAVGASRESVIERVGLPNDVMRVNRGEYYYFYVVGQYPSREFASTEVNLYACVERFPKDTVQVYVLTFDPNDNVLSVVFAQRDAVEKSEVTLTAPDGVELPATIYRPKGCDSVRMPGLVMLHGWLNRGQDVDGSVGDMPTFFALQGYVVLVPSMRGWGIGTNDCGTTQSADAARAVTWLSAQDGVDSGRIGLVGFSFGGQVALLAGALNRRVKAIVSYYGPSDLTTLKAYLGSRWYAGGVCEPDLKSRSPVTHAGEITAPVLLVQGDEDTMVPVSQATEMEEAIRRSGGQVQVDVVKGGYHADGRATLGSWPVVQQFLAAHLGPITCRAKTTEAETAP